MRTVNITTLVTIIGSFFSFGSPYSNMKTNFLDSLETATIQTIQKHVIIDNGDDVLGVGDILSYTTTVTNTGSNIINSVVLTDVFLDGLGNALPIETPQFIDSDKNSTEGVLKVGETATYQSDYTITQASVDTGEISYSVLAEGISDQGIYTNDVSDHGDDNGDSAVIVFDLVPELKLFVLAESVNKAVKGNNITYTYEVKNTGNMTMTNSVVYDILADSKGVKTVPSTLAPGETGIATATYTISEADIIDGKIINCAAVIGKDPYDIDFIDESDSGDEQVDEDHDGDPTNDITVTTVASLSNFRN